MSTKQGEQRGPLTNKHLRWMAWIAFFAAIAMAIWGVATDAVIMAFLTKAAADLGLVSARNSVEYVVDGRNDEEDSEQDMGATEI